MYTRVYRAVYDRIKDSSAGEALSHEDIHLTARRIADTIDDLYVRVHALNNPEVEGAILDVMLELFQ